MQIGVESHRYVFPEIIGGHYWSQPDYLVNRPKGRRDWLLLLTLSGEGLVGNGHASLRLRPGQMALFSPGTPQTYLTHPEAANWELLWLHFHPRADWAPLLAWAKVSKGLGLLDLATLPARVRKQLLAELREAVYHTLFGTRQGDARAMNLLERALLRGRPHRVIRNTHDPFTEAVRAALRQDPAATTLLNGALAQTLGLPQPAFTRRFRERFGVSPTAYGEHARMEYAKHLLSAGMVATTKAAAQAIGFADAAYFSKRFRQRYGIGPGTLRTMADDAARNSPTARASWKVGPGFRPEARAVVGGFCDILPDTPYHILRPNGRRDWLLFLTLSGEGSLGGGDAKPLLQKPGHLALYAPGAPQEYHLAPGASHWRFLWLHFRAPMEWGCLLTWPPMTQGLSVLDLATFSENGRHAIRTRLRAAVRHAQGGAPWELRLTMNLLERALLDCLRESHADAAHKDAFRERMHAYILDTLHSTQRVETLAHHAGLSPSRFAHRFTETFGLSPLAYAERYRLEHAKRLMEEGICSTVKAAAQTVGFDDQLYFSRRFSLRYGKPPSKFLRQDTPKTYRPRKPKAPPTPEAPPDTQA